MTKINNWYSDQPRTDKKLFKPKWTKDTILSIITDLNETKDYIDIQYKLVKIYGISTRSAENWVDIARRVMTDMNNGLDLDQALKRDQEIRNAKRRKTTSLQR